MNSLLSSLTISWYIQSKEDHTEHLRLVLQRLQAEELYAKFKKCKFWLDRVVFLGHVVSNDANEVDPAKIEAVLNWPQPKNVIKVRSFVVLAG